MLWWEVKSREFKKVKKKKKKKKIREVRKVKIFKPNCISPGIQILVSIERNDLE